MICDICETETLNTTKIKKTDIQICQPCNHDLNENPRFRTGDQIESDENTEDQIELDDNGNPI